jgi:hypothetical protein
MIARTQPAPQGTRGTMAPRRRRSTASLRAPRFPPRRAPAAHAGPALCAAATFASAPAAAHATMPLQTPRLRGCPDSNPAAPRAARAARPTPAAAARGAGGHHLRVRRARQLRPAGRGVGAAAHALPLAAGGRRRGGAPPARSPAGPRAVHAQPAVEFPWRGLAKSDVCGAQTAWRP